MNVSSYQAIARDLEPLVPGNLDVLAHLRDLGGANRFQIGRRIGGESVLAISSLKARNASFLATKSVSQLISIRTPTRARLDVLRDDALLCFAGSLLRRCGPPRLRMSTAASISPFDSVSAFLQSMRPAFVISRLPTKAAVISAISN